jgi:cytochrome c biogenesis protein CcmG, thiol:disulfide interchange protein DsbE
MKRKSGYRSGEPLRHPKSSAAPHTSIKVTHKACPELAEGGVRRHRCPSHTSIAYTGFDYRLVPRMLRFPTTISIFFILLALGGCYSGSRPPRIGAEAPDFTVRDSDRTVTLSQLKGQIVVLNFWATWCPPCIEEMPSLVQMQERMKSKGVTVLAVSIDVDENAYREFLKLHEVNLLTVRDPEQKTATIYGSFKWPETYIIDRTGVVRRKFIGPVDWTEPDVIEYLSKL